MTATIPTGAVGDPDKQQALTAGVNIKTINNQSLLGSGNLTFTGVDGNATNTTNIIGGTAGQIPYQSAIGTTSFVANGTAGQVLTSAGTGSPLWRAPSTLTIANITAAYTVVAADAGKVLNCTSGTYTISLTTAATLGSGFVISIWNNSSTSTDVITIDPNASETINGLATLALNQGESFQIICDGTKWFVNESKAMYVANISGGTAGQVIYQSGIGSTSFVTNGTAGQVLLSNGTSAPYWGAIPSSVTSITNDTATSTSQYVVMARINAGTLSTAYTSDTKLYFNPSTGTLSVTNLNSLSDENKKENIKQVDNGLDVIKKLNGVEFDYIESGQHSSGVVAQAIEPILPFLVDTGPDGVKTVNYSGIIAYLIESIKTLEKRIEVLEK